jgi:PAS domain-containing protein
MINAHSDPASPILPMAQLVPLALDHLPLGIMVWDRTGEVLLRNRRWVEMLGSELGGLSDLGSIPKEMPGPDASDLHAARIRILQSLLTEEEPSGDFKMPQPNGPGWVLRLRANDILGKDDDRLGRCAFLEDVTWFYAPGQPTRKLQSMCHDLRNPLSAIMINANMLLRSETLIDERRIKVATRILSSATRMNAMIEDFHHASVASAPKEAMGGPAAKPPTTGTDPSAKQQ